MRNNILKMADEIVNQRTEEKERQYGPFSEGMQRAAQIASGMTGKTIIAEDVFSILIALKLSRHSYNYKEDNLLDACAYLGALDNYINEQKTDSLPAVSSSDSVDVQALELPPREILLKLANIPVEQSDGQDTGCGNCRCNLCE
jgi:hypothetical protein